MIARKKMEKNRRFRTDNFFHSFKMVKKKNAFSLLETVIVAGILVIVAVAVMGIFITSLNCMTQAKEISIATEDLKDVLEKIKSTPFAQLTDPSKFPDGANVGLNVIGGFLLSDENIVVSYPQGANADPLEIQVAITWTGKDKRSYSKTFNTIRTSRL